jgi:L-ribulose-5-phosphate 3-epimerase
MNRRTFLALPGAAAVAMAAPSSRLQIGVTDWNLELAGKLEALDLAASIGFAGVEVSLGRKPVEGRLPLDDASLHAAYLARAAKLNLKLVSTCLDILHINGLKNDKLAEQWLSQAIEINRKLGVRVILLPFFGARAMETPAELDYVADVLRNFAPTAQKANVILGLENTNSARENLRILDRTRSEVVKVFYDTGNSFSRGHDIYREIPMLGKARICQFHFKDNPSLMGKGGIDFRKVLDLVSGIGYEGFADLETSSRVGKVSEDMAQNLAYLKTLMVV